MKNTEIAFFLPPKTMNEATIYYVDILKKGFIEAGYDVVQIERLSQLTKFNKIFVMSAKWCFIAKILNPRARIITWFQGLGAEEALMTRNSIIRKRLWNCVEFFTMKFSWFNIYVSERMHDYYKETYKISDKNYFIMPCFNKQLNSEAFNVIGKYESPTFVYAGGLDKWQCIEQTLELFSLIEQDLPNASLTVLTKDTRRAEQLINKYCIKNYNIAFIALDDLDQELKKYKYGFLIREDHIVNNVSTPTKMNSYLANGIVPIYTNVIYDFNKKLNLRNSGLMLNVNDEVNVWKKSIIDFDDSSKNLNFRKEIGNEIELTFMDYYSKHRYINELKKYLIFLG